MNIQRKPIWDLFNEYSRVLELRGIKKGLPTRTKVISWQHYPVDSDLKQMRADFEQAAMAWDTAGFNVYAVFNDIDESFTGSSVKDSDIEARRHILIDIDRAEKADCPASNAEVQQATNLSDEIRYFMASQG